MQQHHADPGVFIRSMATRGIPGGIARATADLATLLDAAGRDVVIIETVGIGQSEVEIARLAQVTILVMVPGSGDDVQAMKAGVLEVADIFVINKADLPGTDKIEQELHSVADDRPVLRTVASEGQGIAEVLQAARHCKRALHLPGRKRCEYRPLGDRGAFARRGAQVLRSAIGLAGQHARNRRRRRKSTSPCFRWAIPASSLLEPTAPDSVIAKFIEKRGEGLHHVALKVPDLTNLRGASALGRRAHFERTANGGGRSSLRFCAPGVDRRRIIRTHTSMNPTIGIIGGSGLYSMPGFEAQEERNLETPWGAPSDAYVVGSSPARKSRSWRGTAGAIVSRLRN